MMGTMVMFVFLAVMVINISVLILINVHWQPNKGRGEMKELRLLCAEDEQGRTCWMTAFRLFKVTECLHVLMCSFS